MLAAWRCAHIGAAASSKAPKTTSTNDGAFRMTMTLRPEAAVNRLSKSITQGFAVCQEVRTNSDEVRIFYEPAFAWLAAGRPRGVAGAAARGLSEMRRATKSRAN